MFFLYFFAHALTVLWVSDNTKNYLEIPTTFKTFVLIRLLQQFARVGLVQGETCPESGQGANKRVGEP